MGIPHSAIGNGGSPHVLELLGKPGCHLCAEARDVVARVAADCGVPWSERDVTQDPADYEEYGDRIPVLLLDGKEHTYWNVDEARLRKVLTGG